MVFGQKWAKNLYCSNVSVKIWWRHCDVVLDCIVMNSSYELTLVVLYSMQKFVKIECADIDNVTVVDVVFNSIVKNFLTNLP